VSDEATEASVDPFEAAFDKAIEEADAEESAEESTEAKTEESPESTDETPAETVDEPEGEGEEAAEEAVSEPEPLETPGHWTQEDRDAFEALEDRTAQELVIARDKHWQGLETKRNQERSEQVKFADSVHGLLTDADRQQMQMAGLDETAMFGQLLAYQRMATADPQGYLRQVAKAFNVDLTSIVPSPEQEAEEEFLDPALKEIRNEVSSLRQTVAQNAQVTQQSQQNATLAQFSGQTDEAGNPRYPHFETLKPRIGALISSDPVLLNEPDAMKALDTAYNMAVKADPELGQAFIDAQVQAKIAEGAKSRELEKAKRAASPVKPAANAADKPDVSKMGLDAIIDHVMDEAGVPE